jgi:hypothetical protein
MTTDNFNQNSKNQQDSNLMDMDLIDTQAKQIVSLLDTHANDLSMRTLKQLESSRERAVKAHKQRISGVNMNEDGTISHLFSWAEHHRVAAAGLLIGAIFAGFTLMESWTQQNANGDAFLLGAELPPEAFVDRGFEPLLNAKQAKL